MRLDDTANFLLCSGDTKCQRWMLVVLLPVLLVTHGKRRTHLVSCQADQKSTFSTWSSKATFCIFISICCHFLLCQHTSTKDIARQSACGVHALEEIVEVVKVDLVETALEEVDIVEVVELDRKLNRGLELAHTNPHLGRSPSNTKTNGHIGGQQQPWWRWSKLDMTRWKGSKVQYAPICSTPLPHHPLHRGFCRHPPIEPPLWKNARFRSKIHLDPEWGCAVNRLVNNSSFSTSAADRSSLPLTLVWFGAGRVGSPTSIYLLGY